MNSEIQKSSRYTRNAAILPVILFFWTLASLIIPNAVLDITDRYDWATATLNILLPVSAYALLLTYRRRIGVAVVITLPLMIFGAFQLVLSYLYGEAIIAVDMFLNVATTNVEEVNELLGNLIYAIGAVVVLYLPPLIAGIIGIIKKLAARREILATRAQTRHCGHRLLRHTDGHRNNQKLIRLAASHTISGQRGLQPCGSHKPNGENQPL